MNTSRLDPLVAALVRRQGFSVQLSPTAPDGHVIIRDGEGKVLAVNKTVLQTPRRESRIEKLKVMLRKVIATYGNNAAGQPQSTPAAAQKSAATA